MSFRVARTVLPRAIRGAAIHVSQFHASWASNIARRRITQQVVAIGVKQYDWWCRATLLAHEGICETPEK